MNFDKDITAQLSSPCLPKCVSQMLFDVEATESSKVVHYFGNKAFV